MAIIEMKLRKVLPSSFEAFCCLLEVNCNNFYHFIVLLK